MRVFRAVFSIMFLMIFSLFSQAEMVIKTSFESVESYIPGTVNNQHKWKVNAGAGVITTEGVFVYEGDQALRTVASSVSLQVEHIAFASNVSALGGDVYVDFYIRQNELPSSNYAITGYDLGTNTHRSFMIEFQPNGKLKLYDGSSGWTTQPQYTVGAWVRISVKIDNGAGKYQLAINGEVIDKIFNFREIKNSATLFDFHAIRFSMGSGTCDAAVDNLYIGSEPIAGIAFQEFTAGISITVLQPANGLITLQPQKSSYALNEQVSASISLSTNYVFNGWTGDLSGIENPKLFTVEKSMMIGAVVEVDPLVPSVTRTVMNVTQLKNALNEMNPGDTIIVLDGNYNLGSLKITRGGTALKPILVKSERLHGARITGATALTLFYQNYVTYEGFEFDVDPVSTIIKLEGCSYVRITRNKFSMKKLSDTQSSKWITIGDIWANPVCNSHHNRIDHNLFDGKYDAGAWLIIDGSHGVVPDISKYDRIDHNIFRNNTPRVANEKETIRIGVSDLSMLNSHTVVENNLFEDCDGDPEIVSVKSGSNIIRNNTFRRCLGTLSLRHGHHSIVAGNFFLGEGKTAVYNGTEIGCGGVRVYGLNHQIYNNYFEGLTGSKWDAAITITNGDVTNSSTSLTSHFLPENVVFAHNTLVNNVSNIEIGFDNNGNYSRAPRNCRIVNNLIVSTTHPIVKIHSAVSLSGVRFENNLMHAIGTAVIGLIEYDQGQVLEADPLLVRTRCRAYESNCSYETVHELYKLTAGSPAVDASVLYALAVDDIEGQPAIGLRDIGADEFNADAIISNVPMDVTTAGPTASEGYPVEMNISTGNKVSIINQGLVSPNPFIGSTYLRVPNVYSGDATIHVYDATGSILKQEIGQLHDGVVLLTIDQKGFLFCLIDVDGRQFKFKLISK